MIRSFRRCWFRGVKMKGGPRFPNVPATAPTTPKPRCRWLQFSLRTLMVLMLIVSVPCIWLGLKVGQTRAAGQAAREIRELGGRDMLCPACEGDDDWKSHIPSWLGKKLEEQHTG